MQIIEKEARTKQREKIGNAFEPIGDGGSNTCDNISFHLQICSRHE